MGYFEVKRNPELIEIPKNATNGDVLTRFINPDMSYCKGIWCENKEITIVISEEWWNSFYKQEDK